MVIDELNMKADLENYPGQIRGALEIVRDFKVDGDFDNIVVCGMGGSSIGGQILQAVMQKSKIPIIFIREYEVPSFVDSKSLVFAISYSGNTEETLDALRDAMDKGAKIVGIASGGKIFDMIENVVRVPGGLQPRNSSGYLLFTMLGVLSNSGIFNLDGMEVNRIVEMLKDSNHFQEKGKELADKMIKKIPVIYTSSQLGAAAYRFKADINENAKYPAFLHYYPEMCHNELSGFEGIDRDKFLIIQIRSQFDHARIKKRMDICKEIMGERVDVVDIESRGDSLLANILYTVYLGNWASYYLALERGVDPSKIEAIENLKRMLG